MKYLNTLPNSFIVGEKDNDGNILEQYGFPKGGLTYLITGNNIKFYLTEDYFYKNVVWSADAPLLINGVPISVDNLPAALKNIFKVEQEAVDVDTEFDDQSFNPIANAPVTIKFNEVDALQATISGEVESLSGEVATKADIEDIPTNLSELENDMGYITSGEISSDYATKVWVQEQGYVTDISGKQDVSGMTAYTTNDAFSTHTGNTDIHVTANEKETWNNKSDFSGSYNDLSDKPTIPVVPTNVSDFVNDAGYVTQANIDAAVSGKADTSAVTASINALDEKKLDASAYTPTDLSNYYTKDETSGATEIATALEGKADIEDIPTNVSELVNDEGYVTQNDIDAAVSGKVNTTDFNTYSASTDNRLSEDEEVTAAALNSINEALSGKQDTLIPGENIVISGNVISASGGGDVTKEEFNALSGKVDTDEEVIARALNDLNLMHGEISGKADTSAVTASITNVNNRIDAVSGKVDTNEEVVSRALNYLNNEILNKADSSAVTADISAISANIITISGKVDTNEEVVSRALNQLNVGKQNILSAGTGIDITNDVISVTGGTGGITSGEVETMISAATSGYTERFDEDEEVTAAALNVLNDALDNKADTSAVTASIAAAVSGKQDTLISGANIKTINNESLLGSGNINIQTGSSINVVQTTGSSSADVMSQSAVSQSLNDKYDNISLAVVLDEHQQLDGRTDLYATKGSTQNLIFEASSINGKQVLNQSGSASNKFDLVETSAITSSVTSASTDSEIPSAKAVYDALQEGGGGGGKAVSGGTNISITTGETADTVSCTLPISVTSNNANSIKIGNGSGNAYGSNCILAGNSVNANFDNSICVGSSLNAGAVNSQVFGDRTNTNNECQHTTGKLNISNKANNNFGDSGNTLFSVGNGYYKYPIDGHHNAFEIRQNGDIYIADTNDTTYQNYYEKPMIKLQDALGGGGLPESAFTAYTAATDARLSEDEEVTAAGLNALNDALSDKADTSAVTESINAAVSGKADTSAFTAHTADTTIHTTSAEKVSWNGAVTALGGLKLVQLTQAQYDNLATKDASTLYIIVN